jgi:GDP-L-fucose synthase
VKKDSRIYVAGHNGMVGSSIVRKLKREGYSNLILKSSYELDLRDQKMVEAFFENERPEFVFLAAAKVGGIFANDSHPEAFLYDNLMIEMNVINNSVKFGVKKLLFLGSSCIYPKFATQPIREECLLSGPLEHTNEAYALAKISGLKYCQYLSEKLGKAYFALMPTNLYGPNDNYHPLNSHVLPALILKFHEAKMLKQPCVKVWGSGKPLREFLHVDDLASCLLAMQKLNNFQLMNVGSGEEISIKDLSLLIKEIVGYEGEIIFDESKPDGTPRKLVDSTKIKELGWLPEIRLVSGIQETYQNFLTTDKRVER